MKAEKRYYTELDKLPTKLMANKMLIKLDHYNKEEKTKGGIILSSGIDDTSLDEYDKYDQIDRTGIVVMLPENIVFNINDPEGLDWHPIMELKIGDTVWLDHMDANVAERFIYKGERYKLIRYDAVIVAKRGNEVICCNGNILLAPVEVEKSIIIQCVEKEKKTNQGIVKYIGSKNIDYKSNYVLKSRCGKMVKKPYDIQHDNVDVFVGDKVIVNTPEVWLESELFQYFGERVKYLQRRYILGVIE